MKARYVNPFTDFGFKKIFGEEASKPLLIDFLTCIIPEANIVDLTFKPKDKLGHNTDNRKAVYDIYCENINGEKIIVELQKAKQRYFKDRTIYYSTFPIQEQAERGEWHFELKAVFYIGILDFIIEEDFQSKNDVIHTAQLKDKYNQIFYNKLKYVYLQMPNFNNAESELETRLDKWLYFIKHLEDFETIPEIFKDKIFIQAFETAEIANYTLEERDDYEQSLKYFRDNINTVNSAFEDGVYKVAKNLLNEGFAVEFVEKVTGLTKEEIERLKIQN